MFVKFGWVTECFIFACLQSLNTLHLVIKGSENQKFMFYFNS